MLDSGQVWIADRLPESAALMNDSSPPSSSPVDPAARVSPIRPVRPDTPTAADSPPDAVPPQAAAAPPDGVPDPTADPDAALTVLRRKIETVADEFAAGSLNRAQFTAMYQRYSDQRAIIERLIARNPDSDAWRQVLSVPGQTGFLRAQHAAMVLACAVYQEGNLSPLLKIGAPSLTSGLAASILLRLWSRADRPVPGLGRRAIDLGEWLIVAAGQRAATLVIFSQEPAARQAIVVRDTHADFERANLTLLARGTVSPERLVFPQRGLLEHGGG